MSTTGGPLSTATGDRVTTRTGSVYSGLETADVLVQRIEAKCRRRRRSCRQRDRRDSCSTVSDDGSSGGQSQRRQLSPGKLLVLCIVSLVQLENNNCVSPYCNCIGDCVVFVEYGVKLRNNCCVTQSGVSYWQQRAPSCLKPV